MSETATAESPAVASQATPQKAASSRGFKDLVRNAANPNPTPTPSVPQQPNNPNPVSVPKDENKPNSTPQQPEAAPNLGGDPQAGIKLATGGDKEVNMANLRKAKDDAEARATALERQLQETMGRIPADYDQIKADRETLVKEIEKRDITASPRFKEKFDKPIDQQIETMQKTLSMTDVNPADVIAVVKLPESRERNHKLAELTRDMDDISRGKFQTRLAEYDRLQDMRSQEMSNPNAAWQEEQRYRADQQKQQQAQHSSALQSAFTEAEKVITWFKPIEGNDAWNQRVTGIKQKAESFWTGGHSSEELAQLTVAGTMAPLMAEALALAQKQNEELQTQLDAIKGSKPKTQAGSTSSGTGGGSGKYKGHSSFGALMRAGGQAAS